MTRRTIVVPGRLAWHEERFRAASDRAGLQILTQGDAGEACRRFSGGGIAGHMPFAGS